MWSYKLSVGSASSRISGQTRCCILLRRKWQKRLWGVEEKTRWRRMKRRVEWGRLRNSQSPRIIPIHSVRKTINELLARFNDNNQSNVTIQRWSPQRMPWIAIKLNNPKTQKLHGNFICSLELANLMKLRIRTKTEENGDFMAGWVVQEEQIRFNGQLIILWMVFLSLITRRVSLLFMETHKMSEWKTEEPKFVHKMARALIWQSPVLGGDSC